jgi:hypothetical protein
MPPSVSAVRAQLITDAQNHPLPSPQEIDLTADDIPYGSTVRLEVEVESDESLHPLVASVSGQGIDTLHILPLFPSGANGAYAVELRLPTDLLSGWSRSADPSSAPSFPLPDFPSGGMDGEYSLALSLTPAGAAPGADEPPSFETQFRLGKPPAPGGAVPRITSFDSGLANGRLLVGQPWLPRAVVEDDDGDVMAVLFCSAVSGQTRWWLMRDDGRYGDEVAGDGTYSFLRVGGDRYDSRMMRVADDTPVTLVVQALDLRGNWSEPAVCDYTLCHTEPSVWKGEVDPTAPSITAVEVSREQGPLDNPVVSAKCDSAEAWVCARQVGRPGSVNGLLDDGHGSDAVAGDGVYSNHIDFARVRHTDVVCYAVPKSGPPRIGEKRAAVCPPLW